VVKRSIKLIHSVRAESIAHFWAVESDSHGSMLNRPVVSDVGEIEILNFAPLRSIKEGRDRIGHVGPALVAFEIAKTEPIRSN
jgi:hypothetical protein